MNTAILVLFAHPALEKSRINTHLLETASNTDGVTVRDIYEIYPDYHIDVGREQELMESHDILLIQFPFYWYSAPPLVKQWEDLVLQHGWAYGSEGTALRGKRVLSVISTGARAETYCAEGNHRFTMRQLLAPIEQTFALCGMEYLPPFVVHGAMGMTPERLQGHARDYRRAVEALRDGTLDLEAARREQLLNRRLDELIREGGGER